MVRSSLSSNETSDQRIKLSFLNAARSGTVSKTVRLTKQMQSNILKPLPFSPLR